MRYKQLIMASMMVLMSSALFAQRPQAEYDKEKLESARVAFITNRLDLKPDQAEKFWPLFNQYSLERTAIMKDLSNIDRVSDANITEAQAKEMIQKRFSLQQKLLDKEKAFMSDIVKVISPTQAIKLSRVNREFTRQVYRMQRGKEKG